jgi:hypothetical protein
MDQVQDAKHKRVADGDERVAATQHHSIYDLLEQ